ncbi:XRE family transcriptional regulator [Lysobacter sp. TLK-CK17T]|uniref:XRE family transcriptional regulator n=2 Tax=Marilutibacter chinensis TaxID=2912247 RepID=A0ABS9HX05_9GAMM|nr:XRE family transcriptional regulator [Lysobacter chinensis]
MAVAAGLNRTAQIRYEKGERAPDSDYLTALAGIGVDVLYVLTGVPAPTLKTDEAELLRRYRAAPPAVRTAVAAALGTVAVSQETDPSFAIQSSEIGNVMQGGQTITAPLTFNVGGKKGGKKK